MEVAETISSNRSVESPFVSFVLKERSKRYCFNASPESLAYQMHSAGQS